MDCMHNFCDWMNDVLIYMYVQRSTQYNCFVSGENVLYGKMKMMVLMLEELTSTGMEVSVRQSSSSQSFFIYWGLVGKEMTREGKKHWFQMSLFYVVHTTHPLAQDGSFGQLHDRPRRMTDEGT